MMMEENSDNFMNERGSFIQNYMLIRFDLLPLLFLHISKELHAHADKKVY